MRQSYGEAANRPFIVSTLNRNSASARLTTYCSSRQVNSAQVAPGEHLLQRSSRRRIASEPGRASASSQSWGPVSPVRRRSPRKLAGTNDKHNGQAPSGTRLPNTVYQMDGLVLGTFSKPALEADMNRSRLASPGAFSLAHNVRAKEDVRPVMQQLADRLRFLRPQTPQGEPLRAMEDGFAS